MFVKDSLDDQQCLFEFRLAHSKILFSSHNGPHFFNFVFVYFRHGIVKPNVVE